MDEITNFNTERFEQFKANFHDSASNVSSKPASKEQQELSRLHPLSQEDDEIVKYHLSCKRSRDGLVFTGIIKEEINKTLPTDNLRLDTSIGADDALMQSTFSAPT